MQNIEELKQVLAFVKETFVGKDEIVDLLGIALIAGENAYLLGPPGTAKSAIVRQLSQCIEGGNNFEYLLTRFTEPNEIFGPFDIRKLKEGELITNTEGMMPEASMVFLDEIFNANSALLNSLLMALNEKVFRRGKESIRLPALMFVAASNLMPDDEALNALLDRFLVRIKCDYVDTDQLAEVLQAGWALENRDGADRPAISPAAIRELQQACRSVDLGPVRKDFVDLIRSLRSAGITVSDRRAVKFQNLIAASALSCGRSEASLSDLWVLKYTWDSEEQIEILAGIVDGIIENDEQPAAHPRALINKMPKAEDLMKEVERLRSQWDSGRLSFEEQNLIKDKLRQAQSRSKWIADKEHKQYLTTEIDALWQKMLQTI